MKITTNNVPRWLIQESELTPEERKEFDYIDWEYVDAGQSSANFFRYKGQLCDLGEFMKCDHAFGMEGWDGYFGETAWSGLLVRYARVDSKTDDDKIIVGRYTL